MDTNRTENTLENPRAAASGGQSASAGQGAGGAIKQGLQQAGSAVKEGASKAATQVKEGAAKAASQVKETAGQATQQIKEQGRMYADEQKGWIADKISHCSSAARNAADKLREEEDGNLAYYADMLADRMEGASEYVRDAEFRDLVADAQDFVRRRPVLVYGGLFLVGFGLARFLKASSEQGANAGSGSAEDYESDYPYQPSAASKAGDLGRDYSQSPGLASPGPGMAG